MKSIHLTDIHNPILCGYHLPPQPNSPDESTLGMMRIFQKNDLERIFPSMGPMGTLRFTISYQIKSLMPDA